MSGRVKLTIRLTGMRLGMGIGAIGIWIMRAGVAIERFSAGRATLKAQEPK